MSIRWDSQADAYQIRGRPDFNTSLKKEVFDRADDDGEEYIVKFSDNDGKSFHFPSVHRRHKLAWSLWREAVNTVLAHGDETDLESLMSQCFVSSTYQNWSEKQFEKARDRGSYLEGMAKDFFNNPRNVWLGPGDENMGKGGGLDKIIKGYISNPTKKARKKLRDNAYDPHDKIKFRFVEPDPNSGESGGWRHKNVRALSPDSERMGEATDYLIDELRRYY